MEEEVALFFLILNPQLKAWCLLNLSTPESMIAFIEVSTSLAKNLYQVSSLDSYIFPQKYFAICSILYRFWHKNLQI